MAASYRLSVGGVARDVRVEGVDDLYELTIDGIQIVADFQHVDGVLLTVLLNGESFEVAAVQRPFGYEVLIGNQVFDVEIIRPGHRRAEPLLAGDGSPTHLKTPLTGTVVDVPVTVGQVVSAGQVLVVVESMKMNNEVRAPRDGTVVGVHVRSGERVERSTLLITIA